MDDEEDVKKIDAILSQHKIKRAEIDETGEYEDFINYDLSDSENEFEDTGFAELEENTTLQTYDPNSVLNYEERCIIESCNSDEIKNLMVLNRNKNIQLMHLHKQIKDALIECRENIVKGEEEAANLEKKMTKNVFTRGLWRLGYPYFKDADLFSPPLNADALSKKRNNELTFYDLLPMPKWLKSEMYKLLRAVKVNYNLNQQSKICKEIEKLNASKSSADNKDTKKDKKRQLEELNEKLSYIQNEDNADVPELNTAEFIDWNRISDVFFNNKRSEVECRAMWNLFLHPDITKSKFTKEEDEKIVRLVQKYKMENWEEICRELNTNRTPFTICTHYFRNLYDKYRKKVRFTPEEDEMVFTLVKEYKVGDYIPWTKVAEHFENRNRQQIFYRYKYYLEGSGKCKVGKFSDEEDVLLMVLVDRFGRNFKKCSTFFDNRTNVQLKCRYTSNLGGALRKGTFTLEEDEEILAFAEVNEAKSWRSLGKRLKRASGQLRQRFEYIRQYFVDNPGSSLRDVVRRKHSYAGESDDNFHYLRYVADAYKNNETIPTLAEIKLALGKKKKDVAKILPIEIRIFPETRANIDELLINYFSDSFKIHSQRRIPSTQLNDGIKIVNDLLEILNVNLSVPRNFDEDFRLDNIDLALLCGLEKYRDIYACETQQNYKITKLVPPNLNTLVGMRSLLIKHCSDANKTNLNIFDEMPDTNRTKRLAKISGNYRKEQRLFVDRFVSIFKFPAVMTLQEPHRHFLTTSNGYQINARQVDNKRTYVATKRKVETDKVETITSKVTNVDNKKMKTLADKLKDRIQKEINKLDVSNNMPARAAKVSHILSSSNTSIKSAVAQYSNRKSRNKQIEITVRDVLKQPPIDIDRCRQTIENYPLDYSDSTQASVKIVDETTDSGVTSMEIDSVTSDDVSKEEFKAVMCDDDIMSDLEDVRKIEQILLGTKTDEIEDDEI